MLIGSGGGGSDSVRSHPGTRAHDAGDDVAGVEDFGGNTFHDRLGCADEDVGTDHLIMKGASGKLRRWGSNRILIA